MIESEALIQTDQIPARNCCALSEAAAGGDGEGCTSENDQI